MEISTNAACPYYRKTGKEAVDELIKDTGVLIDNLIDEIIAFNDVHPDRDVGMSVNDAYIYADTVHPATNGIISATAMYKDEKKCEEDDGWYGRTVSVAYTNNKGFRYIGCTSDTKLVDCGELDTFATVAGSDMFDAHMIVPLNNVTAMEEAVEYIQKNYLDYFNGFAKVEKDRSGYLFG